MADQRKRVATVVPTLDTRGGTEQITHQELRTLADSTALTLFTPDLVSPAPDAAERVHVRVPKRPAPWRTEAWFTAASKVIRGQHHPFDVIFSPGINCSCATHIEVHAIFAHMVEIARMAPARRSAKEWLRRRRFARIMHWEGRVYRNPDLRLATVSPLAAARLAHYYQRTDVTVLPPVPDTSRFNPSRRSNLRKRLRHERGWSDDLYVVLAVGNAWYSKGFDLLLDAWRSAALSPAALVLLTSERPDHIRRMVGHWPNGVTCIPATTPEIEAYYAAADLVVLASRGETLGLPILEAQAMQTPVLVSPEAGATAYVSPDCVVSPNTPDTWAAAMTAAQAGTTTTTPAPPMTDPATRNQAFLNWIMS